MKINELEDKLTSKNEFYDTMNFNQDEIKLYERFMKIFYCDFSCFLEEENIKSNFNINLDRKIDSIDGLTDEIGKVINLGKRNSRQVMYTAWDFEKGKILMIANNGYMGQKYGLILSEIETNSSIIIGNIPYSDNMHFKLR